MKKLSTLQKELIAKCQKKGIYENFGVKELDAWADEFNKVYGKHINYVSKWDEPKMVKLYNEFVALRNWCGTYNGR